MQCQKGVDGWSETVEMKTNCHQSRVPHSEIDGIIIRQRAAVSLYSSHLATFTLHRIPIPILVSALIVHHDREGTDRLCRLSHHGGSKCRYCGRKSSPLDPKPQYSVLLN